MLRRGYGASCLSLRAAQRSQSTAAMPRPLKMAGRMPSSPAAVMEPIVALSKGMQSDPMSLVCAVTGWSLFVCTYLIMVNWIYTGYLELWDGVYGIDDDDDDDE